MPELCQYCTQDGHPPFNEWLQGLRDKTAQARLRFRLRQLEMGNFGDCKAAGEGVTELRIHAGPGYRIDCGRHGDLVVVLLCGGDKRTQCDDIASVKSMWRDWKERQR